MPELPEVQTTVDGLTKHVVGLTITDVWTDYYSEFHIGKPNIKDRVFFKKFRSTIRGRKIIGANRRGKNVLINLTGNQTILVHMKMTGHLLYGKYKKTSKSLPAVSKEPKSATQNARWFAEEAGPIRDDPYNRFVHVIWMLSNGKHLALSDLRKFAKVTLTTTDKIENDSDLKNLGPEPLDKNFTGKTLAERLLCRPKGKIKQVLMDQNVIAGIGNIYADEILWASGIHPETTVKKIPVKKFAEMYENMKRLLRYSLSIGGSSESDYRDILGRPGNFQNKTMVYGHEGETCQKTGCRGIIKRIKIGGRSAHFCTVHQIEF